MLFLLLALAQGRPQAQPYLALVHGNVLDVHTGDIAADATVVLRDGTIVTGADSSYGPESVSRVSTEIVNYVKLGMSPLEAIQSGTVRAAGLFGIDKETGALEPGLEADLIVVEKNPLEDIRVIQDIILVISNGRVDLNRLPFGRK